MSRTRVSSSWPKARPRSDTKRASGCAMPRRRHDSFPSRVAMSWSPTALGSAAARPVCRAPSPATRPISASATS
eukprot:6481318-Lingulodinium_polyedra.AAC.1